MKRLNGGLAILLGLAAGVATGQNTGYPGYGCVQQGSLEVCMAQLTSDALYALFPHYCNPAFRWHDFTVSVVSSDQSLTGFRVTLKYEVDAVASERTVFLERLGGERQWVAFHFMAPAGAKFVSIRVEGMRTTETLERAR